MKHGKYKPAMIGGMIILGIGFAILLIFVVMWLWNWLMPDLFELTTITFWQAAGLLLLSKILFGGFCHTKKGHSHTKGEFKRKFREKWHHLSDEDKAKWEEKFGRMCRTRKNPESETDLGEV